MTTSTTSRMVQFTLTNIYVFELLAGFMPAGFSVSWSNKAVMQTVDEAISGDYAHPHAMFPEWCPPTIAYRAN